MLIKVPHYRSSGVGHMDNWVCYVQSVEDDSEAVFDHHATGRRTCSDTTRDMLTKLQASESLRDIRDHIDQKCSQFGPSTDT